MTKTELRRHLESNFIGKSLVFRRDPLLNQFFSPGTLANWDSEGQGIPGAVIIGNRTFYPVGDAIDRIVEKSDATDGE